MYFWSRNFKRKVNSCETKYVNSETSFLAGLGRLLRLPEKFLEVWRYPSNHENDIKESRYRPCPDHKPHMYWSPGPLSSFKTADIIFQLFKLSQLFWADINLDSELSLETGETYPALQFPAECCDGTWTRKRIEMKLLQIVCEASIPEDLQSLKHVLLQNKITNKTLNSVNRRKLRMSGWDWSSKSKAPWCPCRMG